MTHYERLGCERSASAEEIKRAFRRTALKTHPDLQQGSVEEIARANKAFSDLSNAYRALIDPSRRREYDRSLNVSEAPAAPAVTRVAQGFEAPRAPAMVRGPAPMPSSAEIDLKPFYDELDTVRQQIWNEPKSAFFRHTLLYVLFLLLLIPVYVVLLRHVFAEWHLGQVEWRSVTGTFTLPLLGIWFAWVVVLRVKRIRAAGGLLRFMRRKNERRRTPRRGTRMELGRMPVVLLSFGFLDAAVIYVSDTIASGLNRTVVLSIVPLVVLIWIVWRHGAMNRDRMFGD